MPRERPSADPPTHGTGWPLSPEVHVYWWANESDALGSAVDLETDGGLRAALEPTGRDALAQAYFAGPRERRDVDGATSPRDAYTSRGLDLRYERHRHRDGVERVSLEGKRRTTAFSNVSVPPALNF